MYQYWLSYLSSCNELAVADMLSKDYILNCIFICVPAVMAGRSGASCSSSYYDFPVSGRIFTYDVLP
jgi:hypothetical protein